MISRLRFFYSTTGVHDGNEPVFFDVNDLPEVQYILRNYAMIREEVRDYVDGKYEIPYFNPSPPEMNMNGMWRNVYFKNYLWSYSLSRKYFPRTFELFANKPEYTLAGITTLNPGGRLMPHCGETNAVIRCHIGLKVPGKLPELGLKVNGASVCWEEGKAFAFNDAYQHEVWNDTDEARHVLAFDIIRPEFTKYRTMICAYCLAIGATQFSLEKLGVYEKTPIWLRSLITKPIALALWPVLAVVSAGTALRTRWTRRSGDQSMPPPLGT